MSNYNEPSLDKGISKKVGKSTKQWMSTCTGRSTTNKHAATRCYKARVHHIKILRPRALGCRRHAFDTHTQKRNSVTVIGRMVHAVKEPPHSAIWPTAIERNKAPVDKLGDQTHLT
eukprot:6468653-Amphidinium_carterae.1